ncbi:hybrid sensor histidine kinase/response regulator [Deinococcus aquiradiocola]|uniref:histidine kinase n=1 Tax=Deinococcus aquiradiocola TaxID=393059 RepID=A0A917UQ94_9DEIO|nr:response regulator [Deinococcus aquiradiocola]GGJ76111.1 hybrid sensor histidine kinase/response regulator [Deinococcus aquiradiocola]
MNERLAAEVEAARADVQAGGQGAARALHSLRAAAAVEGDEDLARQLTRLEELLPDPSRYREALRAVYPDPVRGGPLPARPGPGVTVREASAPPPPQVQEAQSVRIDVRKLDALLALAGELTTARLQLADRLARVRSGPDDAAWREVRRSETSLAALTDSLVREVLAARLQPALPYLQSFEPAVRDAARQAGKRARLELGRAQVDLDRHTMDRLRAPLLHLIRNAVDHGLQGPAERVLAGRDEVGRVTLDAVSRGGHVEVTVADDGHGIDLAGVRQAAVRRGLLPDDADPAPEELTELLFAPGFSSREEVTDLSGRGVGLDVVRTQARALGGDVTLQTGPDGTLVRLQVPLTLATTRVVVVRSGAWTLALPITWVERAGRAGPPESLEGRPVVRVGSALVPAASLARLMGDASPAVEGAYLLLRQGSGRLALLVQSLLDEQEIVIKPLGWPLAGSPYLEGAAILPSGAVVPVLNVSSLLARSVGVQTLSPAPEAVRRRVLVVDDTAVTRQLLCQILEGAGLEVQSADDGLEALEVLRSTPVDLLLTDVEMPRMSGLELARAVRADTQLSALPVVLLTSLARPDERQAGADAGADAYLVKGEFTQDVLLQTVERLL